MDISNQSTPPVRKKINKKQAIKEAQEKASKLQSHRKTDYLPMKDQLSGIFSELAQLRKANKQQLRKEEEVKKHLDAIILDLWVAANYQESPWRRVSLNHNDYSKNKRYSEKFLTYDLLDGVLQDLVSLKYIESSGYFHDKVSKKSSRQTRIKATDKLLNSLDFDISKIDRNPEVSEEEVIIIKEGEGKNKKKIEYVDDRFKIQMREDLRNYNNLLRKTKFGIDGIDLRYKYDTTNITVKRIFIGDSGGGRFYHGFWENMSEEDRSRLQINNEAVCELDYANFQPRIVYANKGIQITNDLYTIEGCNREEVKKAFLVLFNCKSRKHAIDTIRRKGIKKVESLLQKIEQKHKAISESFYNPGFGLHLQFLDSWIAEKVINRLTEKDIACLPIHDSFIVAKKYESELRSLMEDSFQELYSFKPVIK